MTNSADGRADNGRSRDEPEFCSYGEFGRAFIELAVSAERICSAIAAIAGQWIEVGPMGAGPGRAARVLAQGVTGQPSARRESGELVGYLVRIPVDLDLSVELAGQQHRFKADIEVQLRLTVRTAVPLTLVIDVAEPRTEDVVADVRTNGLSSRILQRVGNVDYEIRRQVARYIRKQFLGPPPTVDVASLVRDFAVSDSMLKSVAGSKQG